MKKIPSLFVREYEQEFHHYENMGRKVDDHGNMISKGKFPVFKNKRFIATNKVTPGCEWVINGEGVATRKWGGTAVMIKGSSIFRRYDAKHGKDAPDGFIPCQDPDQITGHWPGWMIIDPMTDKGQDKWIWEAVFNTLPGGFTNGYDGTYEAIGPKINGNKDERDQHMLKRHGDREFLGLNGPVLSFDGIKKWLDIMDIEGIVFHHPDGRMCKVKRSDFGLKW